MTHAIVVGVYRRAAAVVVEATQWLRKRARVPRYQALHGLDALTLKDIGIDRSEISSIEAELYCAALRTRRNLACD